MTDNTEDNKFDDINMEELWKAFAKKTAASLVFEAAEAFVLTDFKDLK